MMEGLLNMADGDPPLCGVSTALPSTYLWRMRWVSHSTFMGGRGAGRPPLIAFSLRVGSAQRVGGGSRAS